MTTYRGTCFCGAVSIEASGSPEVMGYCHCESCRSWSASPINAFTLWKPAAVQITRGAELLGQFAKTERSLRKFCTRCGGHVMADHPMFGLLDIYAAMLPTLPFKASAHVNYGETVLRISDGLPKFKDFPAAMGGSGTMLSE